MEDQSMYKKGCVYLRSGGEKDLEVGAKREVGMDSESTEELVQSSLSLLQECLTHVVEIFAHLFARQRLEKGENE